MFPVCGLFGHITLASDVAPLNIRLALKLWRCRGFSWRLLIRQAGLDEEPRG